MSLTSYVVALIFAVPVDVRREALLLIGGDKRNDKRFYERAIPWAEQLWEAHVKHLEKEGER